MNKDELKRIVIALTPFFAVSFLLVLFVIPVKFYVQCQGGNCKSISENLNSILVPDDSKTRDVQPGDTDEVKRKKEIVAHQRVALIFGGRLNFLFLVVLYGSLCALASVVACVVIYKSFQQVSSRPWNWVFAALVAGLAVAALLYNNPQLYMRIFIPLLRQTIQNDLPNADQLLAAANSIGFASALLLTLAACAVLYPRNTKSFPVGLKQISDQMKYLRLILYVGTFMLIVGILLIRSVYYWSLAFVLRDEMAIKAAEQFFAGLLAVEGGYFTLVLAVVYLPAAMILRSRADRLMGLPEPELEKEKVLHDYNMAFSLSHSLPRIVAILGPLLAGPVGELFSRIG